MSFPLRSCSEDGECLVGLRDILGNGEGASHAATHQGRISWDVLLEF